MRGIPLKVWADDAKIMVKMNNMNMPLPDKECMRLFKRVPTTHEDAVALAALYRSNTKGIRRLTRRESPQARHWEVRFDNIKTKGNRKDEKREKRLERKKNKERGIVKMELNKIRMKDESAEYPTMMACIHAAVDNGCAVVERDEGDKGELNLKLNIGGNRLKLDASGQKAAMDKIEKIMDALGIDGSTKVTFSDQ